MNKTYLELVEEARKKKLKETIKCKKELAKLYTEAYKDIAGKINATNPNIWAAQYQEELRKRIEKLNPALLKSIQGYIQNAASYGVAPEQGLFMNIQGAKAHEIMANLAKIPQKVAHELMSGKFYQDGAGLSARIWNYSKQDQKGVDYIIQQGLLQKKSTLELAKDLEKYLDPSAKKDFEWRKVYPNAGSKTIDFNAFRLASTSITHAYQLATIRAAKENPFAEGLKWHSALSTRTCELCRSRHGQVFKIDEVPLDHPLGLCTTYSVITKSMEEIAEELKKGVYGENKKGYKKKREAGKPKRNKIFNDVTKECLNKNIDFNPIKKHTKKLTEKEIIDYLAGGDKTKGSCSSAAFAYIGNKSGYDVLDFRGGESCNIFSKTQNIVKIANLKGVRSFIEQEYNDYVALKKLLKNVEEDKEYYLAVGGHAAIIRKTEGKLQYLELQSKKENGYQDFVKNLLVNTWRDRFRCQKSYTRLFSKRKVDTVLIDAESLYENSQFHELLGFINTKENEQMKGAGGNVK